MNSIKMIRLKGGEDIICFTETDKTKVKVKYPLNVYINFNTKTMNQELIMNFWLPINIVEENTAVLPMNEILLILDVKEEFKEYYLNFLDDYDCNEKSEDKDEFKLMLENLDAKHNKLH